MDSVIDYKVLIDRYFSGMTSHEEEVKLRRCLMQNNLPAELLHERNCLLAMLQPVEYDCSEEMNGISAMIDNLAAEKTATIIQRPSPCRGFLRYLAPVVAVAAAVLLFFLFFPHSSKTIVQDNDVLLAVADVGENTIEESMVIENSPAKGTAQNCVADEVLLALPLRGQEACVGLESSPVHNVVEYCSEPEMAWNGRPGGNILSEPPVMLSCVAAIMDSGKESALYLLNVYSLMEYLRYVHDDMSSNFSDMAKGVESMATGRPYLPHIEKLIDSRTDSESLGEVLLLPLDSIELAPDDVPWNPATPLRVYKIHNANGETIITFLYSICFDYQSVGFSDTVYVMDESSGDVYNVLGYSGGYAIDTPLVVNGCKGRNILISLRFQKLKRKVRCITIRDSGVYDEIKQSGNKPAEIVIVSGVRVDKYKK